MIKGRLIILRDEFARALPAAVRIVPLILLIACTFRAEAWARLDKAALNEHLAAAETAFREGVRLDASNPDSARAFYREAVLHYERLAKDGGVRSGSLYYNVGNAYFRLGDVGRAILNYKRAALYLGSDANLRQNLQYARDRRADRIEVKQREKVYRTLFFIHYDIPSRIRLLVFAAAFAILWVAAAARLYRPWGWLTVVIAVAAVASAIFLVSLAVDAARLSRTPEGVITADEVTGRMGDAVTYQPSFKEPLHAGTEFRLVERRPGFWLIELESGDRTWIPEGAAELVIE